MYRVIRKDIYICSCGDYETITKVIASNLTKETAKQFLESEYHETLSMIEESFFSGYTKHDISFDKMHATIYESGQLNFHHTIEIYIV